MSPRAGFVLLEEIAPRLKAVIPHIRPVGAEDAEELLQDALAIAAKMLHDLEERGKTVTAGNVAYYTILHIRSGRRSYGSGRSDVMNAGTQLDGRSSVLSFEEPAGLDPETGDEIPLGEMLAGGAEDPAGAAARSLDWEEFLTKHNPRYRPMVHDLAQGQSTHAAAERLGLSPWQAYGLREHLAEDLREHFGQNAIADAMRTPSWRGNIMADSEKAACRADRRRW